MIKSLSTYFRRFFSGVMLSRISGYGRDLSMAIAFGDHPSVAAFLVAFRFSNLMRRLVAEGPFQSTFVPYFEGLRVKNEQDALTFFRSLIFLLVFILCIVCVFVEGGISCYLLSPNINASTREILTLTRWLFPSIIFICLYGLNSSLLSCYDTFFVPSLAPIICNLSWITGALTYYGQPAEIAMPAIAKYVLFGYLGQWLFTMPQAFSKITLGFNKVVFSVSKEVKNLFKSFSLGAVGVGAVQLNVFIDTLFSRYASISGPVYLWYSIRMQQLVIALLGVACVTTVAPMLARAIKSKETGVAESLLSYSYKKILLIMTPCTFAILALGPSSVNLLYGRGAFSFEAISQTTLCLWAYGLGLIPAVMVILFTSYFFALNKFKTPTIVSVASVVVNLFLNTLFIFVFDLKVLSVAVATSISAWLNFFILYRLAKKEELDFVYPFSRITRLLLVCSCTFGVFILLEPLLFDLTFVQIFQTGISYPRSLRTQLYQFVVQLGMFVGLLFTFARVFRFFELMELVDLIIPNKLTSKKKIS